ncbi:MAG: 30S ribosome-binding factor RbfA [Planctomycetes bacterium]|nr:30S ribosome-binding factor RbfA [Planctomycetota bacterium]
MNDRRIARLQEQIKHRLAEILQRDLADPDLGMVTITRVELDREFTVCKAYWTVLGDDKARRRSEGVLRRARGFCQREMGDGLHTRTVPSLQFVFDEGIAEARRVDEVLRQLREERETRGDPTPPVPPPPPEADRP